MSLARFGKRSSYLPESPFRRKHLLSDSADERIVNRRNDVDCLGGSSATLSTTVVRDDDGTLVLDIEPIRNRCLMSLNCTPCLH